MKLIWKLMKPSIMKSRNKRRMKSSELLSWKRKKNKLKTL